MNTRFPYAGLPPQRLWRRAVTPGALVDPQGGSSFRIARTDRIASAGSCFAARIAERLRTSGYRYHVTEGGGEPYGARYGEVYTSLQLRQLLDRARGAFVPTEPPWRGKDGWYDPYRAAATGPLGSEAAVDRERVTHLAAVDALFREVDVFVFTLGLNEVWVTRDEGAALPLCPGAGVGSFDDRRYALRELTVEENVAELEAFLAAAWAVNPSLRLILTVSPVPLVATATDTHVVRATVYGKSVLRVAAETIARRHPDRVAYFVSYEMIATPFCGVDGFESDRRSIAPAAVDDVMTAFFTAFGALPTSALPIAAIDLDVLGGPIVPSGAPDPCAEEILGMHASSS